jgi:hypothetical protein
MRGLRQEIMSRTASNIAARLDWQLGAMIRREEQVWHTRPLREKRERVHMFRLLYDALAELTGRSQAAITSPWNPQEISNSMCEPFPGYWSFVGGLEIENNPLVNAVRVTERQLGKIGQEPRTLDSKHQPVPGLVKRDHAYTVQEVQEMRQRRGASA